MNHSSESRSTDGIRKRSKPQDASMSHNEPERLVDWPEEEEFQPEVIPETKDEPEEEWVLPQVDTEPKKEDLILSTPLPYYRPKEKKWWLNISLFLGKAKKLIKREKSEELHRGPEISESRAASRRSRLTLWGILGGVVIFTLLVITVSFTFARVSLTLKPKVENIALDDVVFTIDSGVSGPLASQRILPAEELKFERSVSEEFASSGKKFIEDRASGLARIYNSFSSSPQSLIATTRFSTDSGVIYRIPKGVTVPGAKIEEGKIVPQFVEVNIIADEAGEIGNLSGEVRLKIPGFKGSPKYEGFYAVAPSGFSGGFIGEAAVVSADDIKKAEEIVTQRVYSEIEENIKKGIPAGFKFIDSVREIKITNVAVPKEGMRAEKFATRADAAGRVIIFKEEDVIGLIRELILKDDTSREFIVNSASFNYQVSTIDFERGKAAIIVSGDIRTKTILQEQEIINSVLGKKEGSIAEVLKTREDLSSFRISFFPPWISKAPSQSSKIRIFIESPGE